MSRETAPHWADEDGTTTVYMCKTDFECEIGAASGGNRIFPSAEDLKENLKCWEGCGIVAVKISTGTVVHEGSDEFVYEVGDE